MSGTIAVAAAPRQCWQLLVKLLVTLLRTIWPLSAPTQRARSRKLLSKETWCVLKSLCYLSYHFFTKKGLSVQTVVLNHNFSIYLGPTNMQYLLQLVSIFKQLFCRKRGYILMLTSLSLEIFLLRQWRTIQASPEILVIKWRLILQMGIWLHGKQPFFFFMETYIAEAAPCLDFHYCRSITGNSDF